MFNKTIIFLIYALLLISQHGFFVVAIIVEPFFLV